MTMQVGLYNVMLDVPEYTLNASPATVASKFAPFQDMHVYKATYERYGRLLTLGHD